MFQNAQNLYYVDRYKLADDSVSVKRMILDLFLYFLSFVIIALLQIGYARINHVVLDTNVVFYIVVSAFLIFSYFTIKHSKDASRALIPIYLQDCMKLADMGAVKYFVRSFFQTAVVCLAMFVYPYSSGTQVSRVGLLCNFICIMVLLTLFNLHSWRRNKKLISKYSTMRNSGR